MLCACVLESCGFVCARAFCEERNMRVPKSPFEQLSSLVSAVQFQTKREIKQRKRREKGGQFFRFDGGELLAEWSTRKRDFGFFFHLVVETDLSEKKVVFSFVSGNTQLTFVGENTHQKLCLRRERRKDERERLGREAFVGEKKKKRFALS